jgi:hypothetical protein
MFKCARPGCDKEGINRCSICLREPYCSGECQKIDWKAHKLICKTLKKLSNNLERYSVAFRVIGDLCESETPNYFDEIRILRHLLLYAEFQFGDRVIGKEYRERDGGERIDNWNVEIIALISIHNGIITIYRNDKSLTSKSKIL